MELKSQKNSNNSDNHTKNNTKIQFRALVCKICELKKYSFIK